MTTRTTGGLIKTSVALDVDLIDQLDEIARSKRWTRSTATREILRLGLDMFRRRQRLVTALEQDSAVVLGSG